MLFFRQPSNDPLCCYRLSRKPRPSATMDLWEAATRGAKELVNMPNLDAMAEEDDYIHTDTLNVTKTTTTTAQQPQHAPPTRQDSTASSQSSGYPAPAASSWMSPALPTSSSHTHNSSGLVHVPSTSSWSLLDRKPPKQPASNRVEEATARLNAMVFDAVPPEARLLPGSVR